MFPDIITVERKDSNILTVRDALFRAEVGEPIPGEEAFHGHDQSVPIGRNGLEEGFRSGFHVAVEQDFTIVAQDTDLHGAGM